MSHYATKVALQAVLGAVLIASAAHAQPVANSAPLRTFASFITDAETPRGFWGEIGSVYAHEDFHGASADAVNTFVHLSYGSELWEAGLNLPYLWADADGLSSENGLGDMRLWGKIIPLRTDIFRFGGGLEISAPTGDEDKFGAGEVGVAPFLTGGVEAGLIHIRSSLGYSVYPGISGSDALNYSVAGIVPIGDRVAIRAEFVGTHLFDGDLDSVSFVPGVDVRFPAGPVEVWLRPTAAAGITDDAPDYQFGITLAVVQVP